MFLVALLNSQPIVDNMVSYVGETGVGCHTGWLSHCQYLIRRMAVPCGDLHITFRVTFVIFVVIVAYHVPIVLFQICMNSPVHRIKQTISYQSDSIQQSVTQMA